MDSADQKKKILLYGIIATVAVFVVVLIFLIVLMVQESKRTKIVFENKTSDLLKFYESVSQCAEKGYDSEE